VGGPKPDCITKRKQIALTPPGTGKQSPADNQTGTGSEACTRNRKQDLHKGEIMELGTTQAERFISTVHKYRMSRPTLFVTPIATNADNYHNS
jgi:hypothetical protein